MNKFKLLQLTLKQIIFLIFSLMTSMVYGIDISRDRLPGGVSDGNDFFTRESALAQVDLTKKSTDNTPRPITLHSAAANGNVDTMRDFLKNGADMAGHDACQWTPLHWAAFGGKEVAVQFLLDCGVNANIHARQERTPLHCAAFHNHALAALVLLKGGALINSIDRYNNTALMVADYKKSIDVTKLLNDWPYYERYKKKCALPLFAALHPLLGHRSSTRMLDRHLCHFIIDLAFKSDDIHMVHSVAEQERSCSRWRRFMSPFHAGASTIVDAVQKGWQQISQNQNL